MLGVKTRWGNCIVCYPLAPRDRLDTAKDCASARDWTSNKGEPKVPFPRSQPLRYQYLDWSKAVANRDIASAQDKLLCDQQFALCTSAPCIPMSDLSPQ